METVRTKSVIWPCLAGLLAACATFATDVTFLMCYRPDHPEDPATKQILSFTAKRPDIRPFQWGGLTLPGAGGRATFMLALAGGTAPDVYKAWFHILRHDVEAFALGSITRFSRS